MATPQPSYRPSPLPTTLAPTPEPSGKPSADPTAEPTALPGDPTPRPATKEPTDEPTYRRATARGERRGRASPVGRRNERVVARDPRRLAAPRRTTSPRPLRRGAERTTVYARSSGGATGIGLRGSTVARGLDPSRRSVPRPRRGSSAGAALSRPRSNGERGSQRRATRVLSPPRRPTASPTTPRPTETPSYEPTAPRPRPSYEPSAEPTRPRPTAEPATFVTGDLALRGVAADAPRADDVFTVAVADLVGVDAADVSVNVAPAARRRLAEVAPAARRRLAEGVVVSYAVRTTEPGRVVDAVSGLSPSDVDAAVAAAAAEAFVAEDFQYAETTEIGAPSTSTSAPPTPMPAAATPTAQPAAAAPSAQPTRRPSSSGGGGKKSSSGLAIGAIIGIVVAVVLVAFCCGVAVFELAHRSGAAATAPAKASSDDLNKEETKDDEERGRGGDDVEERGRGEPSAADATDFEAEAPDVERVSAPDVERVSDPIEMKKLSQHYHF